MEGFRAGVKERLLIQCARSLGPMIRWFISRSVKNDGQ